MRNGINWGDWREPGRIQPRVQSAARRSRGAKSWGEWLHLTEKPEK